MIKRHLKYMEEIRRNSSVVVARGRNEISANSDAGSSLLLALVFLVITSLIVLSLLSLATNNLNNTSKFEGARLANSAANSVTEAAIQFARYNFVAQTLNAEAPCWTVDPNLSQVSQLTSSATVAVVWCRTEWSPNSATTRVVTFSACSWPSVASMPVNPAMTCENHPLLLTTVAFDDYPNGIGTPNCTPVTLSSTPVSTSTSSTCGTGISIVKWSFNAILPTVTGVAKASVLPAGCTEAVSLSGTGFNTIQGVTIIVNASQNLIFTVIPTSFTPTSAVLCVPSGAQTLGPAYFSVTTPVGTSLLSSTSLSI